MVLQGVMGAKNNEEFKKCVFFANDGQKAVHHCKNSRPDLIFMDINMPIMNGYEASRKIKDMYGDDTRIVAVTGDSPDDIRDQAMEAGMD